MPSPFIVTTNADSGAGSLRQAIIDANATTANDEIIFSSSIFLNGPSTITLGAAFPAIAAASSAGSLTISGPGASSLTIDGNRRNFSIFSINTGGNLTISGVTVTGANTSGSGGAFYNSGTLTVNNSTISGNSANHGAGIYNARTATVTNSTLNNNTATNDGGGINSNSGTLTLTNSTISGNTASVGGGIINFATLTVTNSTISDNTAGISNFATLNIANTIIANSTGVDYSSGGGTIGTNTNNLVEDNTLPAGTNNISGDPLLGPLTNNGGPTETMALLTGSPAIATGNATISNASPVNSLDQRSYTRSSTAPSIGAYEFNGVPVPILTDISPTIGPVAGGTTITITGINFTGATAVTINGVPANNVSVVNATSITATTPPGTDGDASVEVTTTLGGTNAANTLFTYAAVPTVTGISPTSGSFAGGTAITISGTGFTTATAITIGGTAATNVTVVSSTSITAIIPAHPAGTASVLVTTAGGTNVPNTLFTYNAAAAAAVPAPAVPFSPAFPHALSITTGSGVVADSASFTVTFNQPVTGVDAADFSLSTTGTVAGGTISSITGSGATRTVQVSGITGAGTLGLNLVNLPTITALPSFAAQSTFATGTNTSPTSVTLGDVNGDGILDMVTANGTANNVSVLLGNGNGAFATAINYAT